MFHQGNLALMYFSNKSSCDTTLGTVRKSYYYFDQFEKVITLYSFIYYEIYVLAFAFSTLNLMKITIILNFRNSFYYLLSLDLALRKVVG